MSEAKAKVAQADAQVALDRSRLAIDREVAKTSGAISKLKLEEDEAKVKESEATLEAMQGQRASPWRLGARPPRPTSNTTSSTWIGRKSSRRSPAEPTATC